MEARRPVTSSRRLAAFPVGAFAGQLYTVPLAAAHWEAAADAGAPVTVLFDTAPSIRVERFYADAASVHRGALAYALQLEENFTVTRDYGWGAKDCAWGAGGPLARAALPRPLSLLA